MINAFKIKILEIFIFTSHVNLLNYVWSASKPYKYRTTINIYYLNVNDINIIKNAPNAKKPFIPRTTINTLRTNYALLERHYRWPIDALFVTKTLNLKKEDG